MRQAVGALTAFLASVHILNEELGLFARAEGELSVAETRARRADGPATEWGFDMLDAVGWKVSNLEALTDEIATDVLERARGLIDALGPKGTEAFYVSASVLVIDAFCALARGSEVVCPGSPIEELRDSLVKFLEQDYGVNLSVDTPATEPILASARELARAWRVRASEIA